MALDIFGCPYISTSSKHTGGLSEASVPKRRFYRQPGLEVSQGPWFPNQVIQVAVGTASGTSVTATLPNNPTVGNWVLVFFNANPAENPTLVNAGFVTLINTTLYTMRGALYARKIQSGDTGYKTVTITTTTSTALDITIVEVLGGSNSVISAAVAAASGMAVGADTLQNTSPLTVSGTGGIVITQYSGSSNVIGTIKTTPATPTVAIASTTANSTPVTVTATICEPRPSLSSGAYYQIANLNTTASGSYAGNILVWIGPLNGVPQYVEPLPSPKRYRPNPSEQYYSPMIFGGVQSYIAAVSSIASAVSSFSSTFFGTDYSSALAKVTASSETQVNASSTARASVVTSVSFIQRAYESVVARTQVKTSLLRVATSSLLARFVAAGKIISRPSSSITPVVKVSSSASSRGYSTVTAFKSLSTALSAKAASALTAARQSASSLNTKASSTISAVRSYSSSIREKVTSVTSASNKLAAKTKLSASSAASASAKYLASLREAVTSNISASSAFHTAGTLVVTVSATVVTAAKSLYSTALTSRAVSTGYPAVQILVRYTLGRVGTFIAKVASSLTVSSTATSLSTPRVSVQAVFSTQAVSIASEAIVRLNSLFRSESTLNSIPARKLSVGTTSSADLSVSAAASFHAAANAVAASVVQAMMSLSSAGQYIVHSTATAVTSALYEYRVTFLERFLSTVSPSQTQSARYKRASAATTNANAQFDSEVTGSVDVSVTPVNTLASSFSQRAQASTSAAATFAAKYISRVASFLSITFHTISANSYVSKVVSSLEGRSSVAAATRFIATAAVSPARKMRAFYTKAQASASYLLTTLKTLIHTQNTITQTAKFNATAEEKSTAPGLLRPKNSVAVRMTADKVVLGIVFDFRAGVQTIARVPINLVASFFDFIFGRGTDYVTEYTVVLPPSPFTAEVVLPEPNVYTVVLPENPYTATVTLPAPFTATVVLPSNEFEVILPEPNVFTVILPGLQTQRS